MDARCEQVRYTGWWWRGSAGAGAAQLAAAAVVASQESLRPTALTVWVLEDVHPQLLHRPLLLAPLLLPNSCSTRLLGWRVPGCRCGRRVPRRRGCGRLVVAAAVAAKVRTCAGDLSILASTGRCGVV